jgi:queuine tRNA-ribosyltransferase
LLVLFLSQDYILTPVFMPVGTQGTVKALDANDMLELGAKLRLVVY